MKKDYYVVQLLKLLSNFQFTYHQAIFSGGTALAKSDIKTYRMSEDIDIKLIPNQRYSELASRNARKTARREIKNIIEEIINQNSIFSLDNAPSVKDEYRYFSFDIRYPQDHRQAPCLRPFIKLEFIETDLLSEPISRNIQSIYSNVTESDIEIYNMICSAIIDTQAEKLLSMLRRTASVARNGQREDDETLIRHVYDTFHIQLSQPSNIEFLSQLLKKALDGDITRYGNQHTQLVDSPITELRYGLKLLVETPKFIERYNNYVSPMVYAEVPTQWDEAIIAFTSLAHQVLDYIEQELNK
ncbi:MULTISPECIES: nucleotidyl transferase AbiEii/AbiGii toxin family protein [unclassified Providencia]|uniref:nucleotidyl transferase AbiEii/AbiGii toxin family protein n=1 Tax=unclassified Providencia TaxID=2633465 RepID=UPI00234BD667|nr:MULTISPECIES: nucleotidyl transferase AbiEii/AbiGii toxin family protein [unclassified Providencia]